MRYGFLIDQHRCIGCHACTVACKEEHDIAVGVNRTWVKYVEKGRFPDVRRHFQVTRCNHCENAPCVKICPTTALFRRENGIVDFDNARCIGCKGCMEACPYDALYLDPETNTAAKCHYCAHKVEVGLEPACVTVCPTRAIIPGDLDDPDSEIGRLKRSERVLTRKPERGTRPQVFYVGADQDVLHLDPERAAGGLLFAEQALDDYDLRASSAASGNGRRPQAAELIREVYDVRHPAPWGLRVGAYLWTKSVSAGAGLLGAVALLAGLEGGASWTVGAPILALAFLGITLALLVFDLKRPERFYYLFTKGNLGSWLVLGGWILTFYGAALAAWLLLGARAPAALLVAAAALGIGSAIYSAALFRQAVGRPFWRDPLLAPHLFFQALLAGAAGLLVFDAPGGPFLHGALALGVAGHGLLSLLAVLLRGHDAEVRAAQAFYRRAPARETFWGGAIALGVVLPLLFLWIGGGFAWSASYLALVGLWLYEALWVRAGQAAPLS